VQSSIDAAVSMWMESNPDLQIVQVNDTGDFTIKWHQTIPGDHVGFQKGSQIDIELGSYDCHDNWNQYSEDNISEAIAHEIGHYLGLGHHSDETHLMYGNDEFTQIQFDDLGYIIPQLKLTELKWIGSENLEEQLEIINTKKTSLERSYEKLSAEYDKYPQTISDPLVYEQALEMHEKLKDLYDIVDHTVIDYNKIVDELNCLANLE